MSKNRSNTTDSRIMRYLVISAVVAAAFFVSYQFASAQSADAAGTQANAATSAAYSTSAATAPEAYADSGSGCACCGGSSGEAIEAAAVVESDGVQRISVDTLAGYDPNVIVLEAGVPAEITFSEGYGCLAEVMSSDLGFFEDLQSGPRTIALDALEPGTYGFSCGMEMVFGQIVVE
jgi:hypothetical protein